MAYSKSKSKEKGALIPKTVDNIPSQDFTLETLVPALTETTLTTKDGDFKDVEPEVLIDEQDDEEQFFEESLDEPLEDSKDLVIPNVLQRYLSEIRKYPLMSRDEEYRTAQKAYEQDSLDSKKALVTANLRLVVKIAMGYRRAYAQILDLIQEGNAGLVQAVHRFNPYKGVKLSTYSAWWIRAYILKFLMDNKSLVRIGTTDAQRKLFFKLRSEAEKMYALTQHFDTKLLAQKIGVQEQDVIDMQQRLSKNDLSLDSFVSDDNETRHIDLLSSDENVLQTDEQYEKDQLISQLKSQLEEIKKTFDEREFYIFENRILADEPLSLQEIGAHYNITRERVRQLETRTMKKIKSHLQNVGFMKNKNHD